MTHPDAGHESASHYLLTGYRPTNDIPAQEMPSYGSIVAKERGPRRPGLPAYVAVPNAAAQRSARLPGRGLQPVLRRRRPEQRQLLGPQPDAAQRHQPRPAGEPPRACSQSIDTLRRDSRPDRA